MNSKKIPFKIYLTSLLTFFYFTSLSSIFNRNLNAEQKSLSNNNSLINKNINNTSSENIKSQYLLGSGDVIYLNFLGAKFLNGTYSIPQEGYITLPEIGDFYLIGKSLEEVEKKLKIKYDDFLYKSDLEAIIVAYRPITIYINGEVAIPGLYTFEGFDTNNKYRNSKLNDVITSNVPNANTTFNEVTLYEVIQQAKGVTNYANLSNITVIRENSKTYGGGKIKTSINLLSLLEKGDQSQNIRIMDGDSINIPKGDRMLKDQILSINKSNISPAEILVYVTGNVVNPGSFNLRQGTSLNQAIASTGGKKIWTGKIDFIRFNDDGSIIKETFSYDPESSINTRKNPILMSGDIINVRKNIMGKTNTIVGEIAKPVIGTYGLYNIFFD